MKTKTIKRTLSMVLALVLALSMMVVPVSAATYDGGIGTEKFPYLISTAEQLTNALTTETSTITYFKLTSDIALESEAVLSNTNASIDMDGHDVSGATITINAGTLKILNAQIQSAIVINGGTVSLTNVELSGSVAINGGTVSLEEVELSGTMAVSGGTVVPGTFTISGDASISGGNWGGDFILNTLVSGTLVVTGGIFETADPSNYLAEGYVATYDTESLVYVVTASASSTPIHIYNNMILSSSLTFNFLISKGDLADVTGYTMAITKTTTIDGAEVEESTVLSLIDGSTYSTFYSNYWIVSYDEFYVYEYESKLTAVLTDGSGNVMVTEQSYTNVDDYLDDICEDSSTNVSTMARAILNYCQAAKVYYQAQEGKTVNP